MDEGELQQIVATSHTSEGKKRPSMMSSHINIKKMLLILYIAILHLVLIIALLKSNILHIVSLKFGAQPPEITEYYRTMVEFHRRADGNIPDGSIIIIGDSITQGLCVSCISHNVINYGIASDTSLGVINRIQGYKSITKAKAIVLAIGINDLTRRNDKDIVANFREIINTIPADIKIVISAILPVDERVFNNSKRSNDRIRKLNLIIGSLCTMYSNCSQFDSRMKLSDSSGNLKREFHVGDGVHLNTDAYFIWISDIREALKNIEALND